MAMTITNLTNEDYWFGPLHLQAGNGQTLVVDDTTETSLYLTDDRVADAINTLYAASPPKITVTGQADPFPRATGTPQVLHGDGSPEGIIYAAQGSIYLRRDITGDAQLYQKATGIHVNTDWVAVVAAPTGAIQMYGGLTAPAGWLLCDGSAVDRTMYADLFAVIGTTFGGTGSTFNVPDLQGRVAVGRGTNASVSALGLSDNQTTVANRRPHHRTSSSLALSDPGHAHFGYTSSNQLAAGSASPAWATPGGNPTTSNTTGIGLTGSIGTGNASDALDTPSFLVVNYIIKT